MSAELEAAVARFGEQGSRRFAGWDAAVFADLAAGPARRAWKRLEKNPEGARVLDAYLALAVEAIGLGYLDRAGFDEVASKRAAPNLIALLLVRLVPSRLFDHPPEVQVALLARAWNAGEGLLREASWMNRYVTHAFAGDSGLVDLEERLAQILEPALTVRAPSSFRGPFAVSTLDLADLDEELLPGDMHLAAPTVLCVHDRKRPEVFAGVSLRARGESALLSLMPCLGETAPEGGLPPLRVFENGVRIGDEEVPLPSLRRAHRTLVARLGFCVASAVDSQWLWIVESP